MDCLWNANVNKISKEKYFIIIFYYRQLKSEKKNSAGFAIFLLCFIVLYLKSPLSKQIVYIEGVYIVDMTMVWVLLYLLYPQSKMHSHHKSDSRYTRYHYPYIFIVCCDRKLLLRFAPLRYLEAVKVLRNELLDPLIFGFKVIWSYLLLCL